MLGHLWYLSEELVALACFDNTVSLEEKSQMLLAMKIVDGANQDRIGHTARKISTSFCNEEHNAIFSKS